MFEDASDLIAHNPPGCYAGVAVAELERGRFSFVLAADGPNRVLAWSAGALRDVTPAELRDADGRAAAVAAGDLDGDGREELYVANAGSPDRLFRRTPEAWADLLACPSNRAARNRARGRAVAAIDRRGVGRYGFAVAGRSLRLLELNPAGVLADLAPALGLARPADVRAVLAAPLFAAAPDLFCAGDGPNLLFRNRGDGTFAEGVPPALRDCGEGAHAAAAFDAGGAFGVAWVNDDGPHRLAVQTGDGCKDVATPAFAFPSAARGVLAADFDNDGDDELFLTHDVEPNRLFRVTPPQAQQGADAPRSPDIAMLPPGAARDTEGCAVGAAVADIDGDGVLELLVVCGPGRPLAVFKARGARGNWLRVCPRTRFGAPARGAAVRAEYGGRVRVKCIDAGGGACQSEPVAHFGLGATSAVERVQVTWPDGAAVTVLNPGGNRVLTVPYPRG